MQTSTSALTATMAKDALIGVEILTADSSVSVRLKGHPRHLPRASVRATSTFVVFHCFAEL